jgi:hypothetical protein
MSVELTLRYADISELQRDYESNLRKGRAFVLGRASLAVRQPCMLSIEHPEGGAPLSVRAEAVWVNNEGDNAGTGVEFVNFDASVREALQAFVVSRSAVTDAEQDAEQATSSANEPSLDDATPGSVPPTPSSRNLHDRVRDLDLTEREALARQGSMPERVALERRYGSSVWEGLLHNPMVTAREVCRMARSGSLPSSLVNLIVANKAWVADGAVQKALLENPRVSGPHIERVLRALSQTELARVAEANSVRMQVRVAAKKLIRR